MLSYSWAQGGLMQLQSSEARALGGNQAAAFGVQSLLGNPAGLSKVNDFSALVTAETRFATAGILLGGAGVALPSELGTFGVSLGYLGIPEYREQSVAVSYARALFESFAISVQAQLYNFSIQDYGSQFTLTGTLGAQAFITPELTLGTYIRNPVRVTVVPGQELPTVISLGAQYAFPEKLKLLLAVEKDLDLAPSLQFGLQYNPVEKLSLRLGVHTEPEELTVGIAYQLGEKLRLDAMTAYHQVLGLSPGITLIYQ